MTNNPYAKIKHNSVMTASPEELTLMLYNGAIKFGNQGLKAIKEGNIEEAHNKITRVDNIVLEFMASLNHDYSVAADMEVMYDYMHYRLREANVTKDAVILEEIVGLLREFRDTWKEAMDIAKGKKQYQPELEKQAL